MELYTAVATCMLNDSYYEKKQNRLDRIRELVAACKPEFVARLAVYARTENCVQMKLKNCLLIIKWLTTVLAPKS